MAGIRNCLEGTSWDVFGHIACQCDRRVLPFDMVDKSTRPFQTHFGLVFGDEVVQRGLLFPYSGSRKG